MKQLAVYCGSKKGKHPSYTEAAKRMAEALLSNQISMVYGGGHVGIMGVIANAMLKKNGKVIGVIPKKLVDFEVAHDNLTTLKIVTGMHERKKIMMDLSDGFITLPGGIGTMEELFEVFTWQNIGYHNKPCGLLNVNDYYTPLIQMIDKMVSEGFLSQDQRDRLIIDNEADQLLEKMKKYSQNQY